MKHLLVVEDDSFLNKMLSYNLAADGYEITSALNARTAVQALRSREFDLVLLDINLPDGNGFELCRLIKPEHADTIVIFLTANDQESDQIRGYEAGAVDYITKPFVIGALQRRVRSQTDKLDFLFQALVKTSRLETGVIRLEKRQGRIYDTVAQAMCGIVYAAEKKQIDVSVNCPENLTASHDSKWTAEALFNLLDNAVKYTPTGGKITVTVEGWEMYAEIKVTDTGKGIPESSQAAIFRRFYREEEVHEQPGVGIGLYLAREIITRQGGYMKVASEPGKGSAFSIMLPLR